jgi:hypothetical protein
MGLKLNSFFNFPYMKKIVCLYLLFSIGVSGFAQPPAKVDKKTKEFIIPPNPKTDFSIIGYEYPNLTTKKMICFSTNSSEVREDDHDCPLGAYFDTNHLKEGDMIYYIGPVGTFAKMNFIHGNGKKTIFYIPKNSFVIK